IYINNILIGLINIIYIIYLNNILIYSKNKENYINYIKEVLQQLQNRNLYINLNKYKFNTKRVSFLKYIVSPEGVLIDLERVIVITK
ncbi:hypothetical protein GE21DRAFT_1220852, partial [Neurospora crassa]